MDGEFTLHRAAVWNGEPTRYRAAAENGEGIRYRAALSYRVVAWIVSLHYIAQEQGW